jgi:hypothetical protein
MLSKRLINSNDAAAGGACTTNTNDYPTTNVAYYKMSTAADEKDTYNGAATDVNFNVQGKYGNAAEFNGSSSVISLGTSSPLNTFGGAQTISVWVKPSASRSAVIGYRENTTSYWNLIEIMTNNSIRFLLMSGSGSTALVFNSAGTITLNQWNHIAVTVDSTSAKIYINNGSPETASNSITSFSNTETTYIGYSTDVDATYFTGQIDQVRIFSSALDATQVESLYNEVYCVPTIVPTDHFEPFIYPGNGGTKQITTLDFQPDFTWIKNRNNSASGSSHAHALFDSVRTSGYRLVSNTDAGENDYSDYMTGFNSGGFNLSGNPLNDSAGTYVSWNWKAGGAAVTIAANTVGNTIASDVSANVDAGFSIVSYAGGGSSGSTVGTGLNQSTDMIFVKNLSAGTDNWIVWHKDLEQNSTSTNTITLKGGNVLLLNTTNSTVSYGYDGQMGATSGENLIAYCFHSVAGYSKMGSYVGGGTTDVPVNLGFRPAFVMVKASSASGNWTMYDNKRQTGTAAYENYTILLADDSYQEQADNTVRGIQFNSSGFILNQNYSLTNTSGVTYIFMAFAEEGLPYVTRNATNPFGDSSELALYKFEDNANDAEGSYNGSATASVTYPTGYIDKGLSGFTSSQYVSIPTMGVFLAKNTSSVSMWIKSSGATSPLDYFFADYSGSSFNHGIYLAADGSIKRGTRYSSVDSAEISSSTGFADNNWHHVVSIVNTSDNTQQLYVDGSLAANGSVPTNSWSSSGNTEKVLIGGLWGNDQSNNLPFGGSIDQVRIFDRALDDGEVTALYNE